MEGQFDQFAFILISFCVVWGVLISFNVDIPVDKIIFPLNLDIYFNISVVNISPDGILTIGIFNF